MGWGRICGAQGPQEEAVGHLLFVALTLGKVSQRTLTKVATQSEKYLTVVTSDI